MSDERYAAVNYNYAEALQKSLYLYDANKSGPGVAGGRLSWRGDSEVEDAVVPLTPMHSSSSGVNMAASFIETHRRWLDPENRGTVDVSGGFHDAGDHVKFGLPQGYTLATLGWAFYEFREAFVQTQQDKHMLELLRWGNDYFLRCIFRDDAGSVVAFAYQVGEGFLDHQSWAPPEVKKLARPVYFATSQTPASDVSAAAATSLTLMYLNVKDSDVTYADKCLDHARALYAFACQNRGLSYSGGFYNSSYDEDELSWAATWLYIATGEADYLDDVIATTEDGRYSGYLKKIIHTVRDTWRNDWVYSWDTVWGGVFLKLAALTNEPGYWNSVRWNLEFWSGIEHGYPDDHTYVPASPAGFRVINIWGSARYNVTAQFCALVYCKYTGQADFADWARGQMDYLLGCNPLGRSYIIGFGENYARHPHHRAAHCSLTNDPLDPQEHRHILWGALVGGPGVEDEHKDETTDYRYNEVAIDYNAGLVGALAGLYTYYAQGQQPLADFPPPDLTMNHYYIEARVEGEDEQCIQLWLVLHCEVVNPPGFENNLKARYFVNLKEMIAVGQCIEDFKCELYYDQEGSLSGEPISVHGPLPWNEAEGIYYIELNWSGRDIWQARAIQFSFQIERGPDRQCYWHSINDWSRQDLSDRLAVSKYIPVYRNDLLVHGSEPGR